MRPLIAIPGRRSAYVQVLRFSGTIMSEAMCEAVWAAGGEPLVLHGPDADPTAELKDRLARFDGVVMPGGGDVDPAHYGQDPVAESEAPVSHDDDLDLGVVAAVLALGTPTLAICRGMQIVNIALGGTLVQHLAAGDVEHRGAVHEVSVTPGSRLRDVTRRERIAVSSYHHQAIDRTGVGLTVVARADDGCIEAIEHPSGLLGVQWHPEDLHTTNPTDAVLFTDLVERAAKHRADR
ncbi:gamma-glutamyl-gamma-aminobutyrate hydrolase family protein [Nocardioides panacihumi]|uniref:Gamma-glutamyl-gamma-aminobutyrate hydrolase family protein n=2 Tax=Nocardioides panacihumi TaxID=400774 RepID=A0ABN2RNE1_9ACTN